MTLKNKIKIDKCKEIDLVCCSIIVIICVFIEASIEETIEIVLTIPVFIFLYMFREEVFK